MVPDPDPRFDFTGLWSTRLACPRLLNFVEQGFPLADVLLEDSAHFLLHRAAVSASESFERFHDFGWHIPNRQGCHRHLR
jgi:hypothetical protein